MLKTVKEKLEKQLELLSELSKKTDDPSDICQLTTAMTEIAKVLGLYP